MAADGTRAPGRRRPPGRRRGLDARLAHRLSEPDEVTPGTELILPVLPFAVVAAVFAVLSLTNAGPERWAWRQASLGMLVSNALACGSLTGVVWYFAADPYPYADEEMQSTGPGPGTWLALLGCLLIPLAGSLPYGQRRPARPDRTRP
jgi:hypothetical protein